ncbi:MAG: efflux RND transporter periplasmic adaptor subunit [Candidatus Obscuribacterales bacterium]|nr:efflux RND transporter periplasmic adaptor subunit [Candidatus Obscuribacterales bacterium]
MESVKKSGKDKDAGAANLNGNGGHKKLPLPLLVMALVILGTLGWHFFGQPVEPENQVFVSGRIEGYETDVAAKIGGRVETVLFREGDLVKKDTLVATLTDDDIQAQLRQASARLVADESIVDQRMKNQEVMTSMIKQSELQLSQSKEDVSAQIDQNEANIAQVVAELSQAKANLVEAKAARELAKKRKSRFEKLIGPGAVTKDEYDEAITNYEMSSASVESKAALVNASEKKLKVARALLDQAKATRYTPNIRNSQVLASRQQQSEAQHQISSARADVLGARAQVDEIKAQIAYLNLLSPITGVVTARSVEPGAVVVPGETIISLIDLEKVYLRGYVPEGSIGKVRIGQKARVLLDSFPDKPFDGKVIQIDPVASFTPENIYFKDDRVKQVFGIKIQIVKPGRFAKPGMPADAEILTDSPDDKS